MAVVIVVIALAFCGSAHAQSPAPEPRVQLSTEGIELREPLRFEIDDDELRPQSLPILEELVALLLAHPERGVLRIEGHMNEETRRESEYRARVVWRDRAYAVRDYLVAHGVPPERLTAEAMLTDVMRCDPRQVRGPRRRQACALENNRIVLRWQSAQ